MVLLPAALCGDSLAVCLGALLTTSSLVPNLWRLTVARIPPRRAGRAARLQGAGRRLGRAGHGLHHLPHLHLVSAGWVGCMLGQAFAWRAGRGLQRLPSCSGMHQPRPGSAREAVATPHAPEPTPVRSAHRHGDGDRVVPPTHAHWWHKRVAGSELHVVPDEGHISLVGRHAEQILQDLLRGQLQPGVTDG